MDEYGIFNDEGLLEGQFYSRSEAQFSKETRYIEEDESYISFVCPYHPEQPKDHCEICNNEDY